MKDKFEKRISRRRVLRNSASALAALKLGLFSTLNAFAVASPIDGLRKLRDKLKGSVLTKGSESFDVIRRSTFYGIVPNRCPDMIVRAKNENDVISAINYAAENGLKVTARGGGHHYHYSSVRDEGLMIDLSQLTDLNIDPISRTASVQPGVVGAKLIDALSEHNLAFPVGHSGSIPISGYLLSGGIGWNFGEWGYACHSVSAVDVVTASGEQVFASAEENSDLFWAAMGAGSGFFGVVTMFHLKLHPMPRTIAHSSYSFPFESIAGLGDWLDEYSKNQPDNIELFMTVVASPPESEDSIPFVVLLDAFVFADSGSEAESLLAQFSKMPEVGNALSRHENSKNSFNDLFSHSESFYAPKWRLSHDDFFTSASPSKIVETMRSQLCDSKDIPDLAHLVMIFMPNTAKALNPNPSVSFKGNSLLIMVYSLWTDSDQDTQNIDWVQQTYGAFNEHVEGHHIGSTDLFRRPNQAKAVFGEDWSRLQKIRKKYDPNDVFHTFPGLQ